MRFYCFRRCRKHLLNAADGISRDVKRTNKKKKMEMKMVTTSTAFTWLLIMYAQMNMHTMWKSGFITDESYTQFDKRCHQTQFTQAIFWKFSQVKTVRRHFYLACYTFAKVYLQQSMNCRDNFTNEFYAMRISCKWLTCENAWDWIKDSRWLQMVLSIVAFFFRATF